LGYHVVLSAPIDLADLSRQAAAGQRPRHAMAELSQRLGAQVHQPGTHPVSARDRVRAKITSQPAQWALARFLGATLTSKDVVFCMNEDVGIPLMCVCGSQPDQPKIATYITNLDRPRGRLALKLFRIADRGRLLLTPIQAQYEFLQRYLDLPDSSLHLVRDQTDVRFFQPGPERGAKTRPLVVSGGMEKRDYSTLAVATQDLDVDVKVCAFSHNATATARTFPPELPKNMYCGFFDWPDLLQLYQDADVVAIPLFENKYSAGTTTLLEAMACRKPVVITHSPGLIADLVTAGCVTGVAPGDSDGLQRAIEYLLTHPAAAAAQAQRGYDRVLQCHSAAQHVDELVRQLQAL
jgi:hypothetical protein